MQGRHAARPGSVCRRAHYIACAGADSRKDMTMKKTIAAIILAALAASPAMAKTIHHRAAPANAAAETGPYAASGYYGTTVVTGYGMVLGQDPDANVRAELTRAPAALSGE